MLILFNGNVEETQEEIGVSGANIRIIGTISKLDIKVFNYVVLPVIGFMDRKPNFTPHPYEVAEIIEISLVDLFKDNVVKEKITNGRSNFANTLF